IGLIQTADGALSEYSNILDTIKTKAVQASSDTQNTSSRLAIQKDIDKLMEELNVISKTTSFNGQKLLSGNYTNKEFQMGANANESVKLNISSTETNQIGHTSRTTLEITNPGGGDVALSIVSATTGAAIQLKDITLASNNQADNGMGALADEINRFTGETGISAKAVVETSTTNAITAGTMGSDFTINGTIIGNVIVEDNDNNGALLNAINSKTTQTGVAATIESGKMTLTSTDGRAIKVEGTTASNILGNTNADMSTIGHLELVQVGSSDFQITNKSVGAVGFDLITTTDEVTTEESTVASGSTLLTATILKQGSTIGGSATIGAQSGLKIDQLITKGSTISAAATIEVGTTLGGKLTNNGALTLDQDMLVTAGSLLKANTALAAGTVITTEFKDINGDIHPVGETLNALTSLAADITLSQDMVIKKTSSANSIIATGSEFNTGSVAGADLTSTLAIITEEDMVLKKNSVLATGTILKAGSTIGQDVNLTADLAVSDDMTLATGSTIKAASTLSTGSTIGNDTFSLGAATTLTSDMSMKSGSVVGAASILKAGTVMSTDTTAAQTGVAFKAGEILKTDLSVTAVFTLTADMTILKGSELSATTVLQANDGKTGSLNMGSTTNDTLADIDVTTLSGAMKAIDTVAAAITSLDAIRSDLGSAQNQVVSTVNNISVTQVNVKAAESSLRDVDFAAESANFS
ncbi:flagellin, partial [Sulfurimonas sp. SAG-AH-194-I05]